MDNLHFLLFTTNKPRKHLSTIEIFSKLHAATLNPSSSVVPCISFREEEDNGAYSITKQLDQLEEYTAFGDTTEIYSDLQIASPDRLSFYQGDENVFNVESSDDDSSISEISSNYSIHSVDLVVIAPCASSKSQSSLQSHSVYAKLVGWQTDKSPLLTTKSPRSVYPMSPMSPTREWMNMTSPLDLSNYLQVKDTAFTHVNWDWVPRHTIHATAQNCSCQYFKPLPPIPPPHSVKVPDTPLPPLPTEKRKSKLNPLAFLSSKLGRIYGSKRQPSSRARACNRRDETRYHSYYDNYDYEGSYTVQLDLINDSESNLNDINPRNTVKRMISSGSILHRLDSIFDEKSVAKSLTNRVDILPWEMS